MCGEVQLHKNQVGLRAYGRFSMEGRLGYIIADREYYQAVTCVHLKYLFKGVQVT